MTYIDQMATHKTRETSRRKKNLFKSHRAIDRLFPMSKKILREHVTFMDYLAS